MQDAITLRTHIFNVTVKICTCFFPIYLHMPLHFTSWPNALPSTLMDQHLIDFNNTNHSNGGRLRLHTFFYVLYFYFFFFLLLVAFLLLLFLLFSIKYVQQRQASNSNNKIMWKNDDDGEEKKRIGINNFIFNAIIAN